MATSRPAELYPLSTQDGTPIPLDIIKPLGLIVQSFTGVTASFLLPSDYPVVIITTDKACFLGFDVDPFDIEDGAFIGGILYIPENSTMTVAIPEDVYSINVLAATNEAGSVVVQMVQQWASISLQTQSVRI